MEIPVYDIQGATVETMQFDESVLGKTVHYELLHRAVVMYEANRRVGTASAKTLSEVVGSTRKPWRQKGTGRARVGSRRNPIWTGGGVAFPPKPREFRQSMPKKARRLALKSALLGKLRDDEIKVVDTLSQDAPKTKEMADALRNIGIDASCLVVIAEHHPILHKSFRNIPSVELLPLCELNAYAVLRRKYVLFTKDALTALAGETA